MTIMSAETTPRVGRYEVVREIGRGGMAVVYLARQPDLERDVALKELRLLDASDSSWSQRFLQESRVAASLVHPNVVTVHDYFEHDGTPYIAMEYLERGSLRPCIGRTSVAENIGVLEGVLAGLDHAAHHGIVHRDIKPENLMVTAEGRIKIADFGIAKAGGRAEGTLLTRTGVPVGTPWYMAPEQARGGDVGPWTDLYAVGIVAWELFVGHVPFHDAESAVAVLLRHINEDVPSAHTVEPTVDPAISEWIDRLLARDPQERRSASEVWEELEDIATATLGSCWRREARLRQHAGAPSIELPLTPAPFAVTGAHGDPSTADGCIAVQGHVTIAEPSTPAPAPRVVPARSGAAAPPAAPPWSDLAWSQPPAARPRRRVAAVGVLVAGAAVAAGVLAHGSGQAAPPVHHPVRVLESSAVRVTVPATWARGGSAVHLPGLTEPVSAGPDQQGDSGVEAGVVEYSAASLLSPRTAASVVGRLPAPVAVRLGGGVQAYRYDRLRLRGRAGRVTIYAAPTTERVATLACFAPAQTRRFDAACASVAATLRPTEGRPEPVVPDTAYAAGVTRALARLSKVTAARQLDLDRATDAAGQATAAGTLARAYEDAHGAFEGISGRVVDGIAGRALITTIEDTAKAYRRLASAAEAGAPADYDRARREVKAMRRRLQDARKQLARAGYEVR